MFFMPNIKLFKMSWWRSISYIKGLPQIGTGSYWTPFEFFFIMLHYLGNAYEWERRLWSSRLTGVLCRAWFGTDSHFVEAVWELLLFNKRLLTSVKRNNVRRSQMAHSGMPLGTRPEQYAGCVLSSGGIWDMAYINFSSALPHFHSSWSMHTGRI